MSWGCLRTLSGAPANTFGTKLGRLLREGGLGEVEFAEVSKSLVQSKESAEESPILALTGKAMGANV